MALTTLRRALIVLFALLFLIAPNTIFSCGPFFITAIFAFRERPDSRNEDFAEGKLGIVRPEFRQSYLVVAYRYLSGLKLDNMQQKAAQEVWERKVGAEPPDLDAAIAAWDKARSNIPGVPAAPEISAYAAVQDQSYSQYLNCPTDAFQNAARTLENRASKFGATSAEVREWVSAQDQVFANCDGSAHAVPALSSSDLLLRADHAYQTAAAHFYAGNFNEAFSEFDAITNDRSSPWNSTGRYLAARALIRRASLSAKRNEQPFDRPTMLEAQKRLETIVADSGAGPNHEAALKLLNYVRFRTEPEKRVPELDRMILMPVPGNNFKQDLWDYVLLLSHGDQSGDPSEWVLTFQALAKTAWIPREQAAKQALSNWKQTKSLPWLIAALVASDAHTAELGSLLRAASQIPRSSPAYVSARYYALRLMIASGQSDAARPELDLLLKRQVPEPDIPLGSRNLLNEERLRLTTGLDDFLQHAPEEPVPADVDFNTDEEIMSDSEDSKASQPLFNHYAAETLRKRIPVADLVRAAESSQLPKHLRREVARSGWVRAILLNDLESGGKLQSALQELDPPLWKTVEPFRLATDAAGKHFAAIFIILNNPGMRPSVREGSSRSARLGEIDNYHDNWWCTNMSAAANWDESYSEYNKDVNLKFVDREPEFPFPTWLTRAEKTAAVSEWAKVSAVGAAPNYLAEQVLEYAKAHAQDARVPPALHLVVRSTRYGCTNSETSKLSKAAFDLLHNRYPENEWAAKTKYYY